MTRAGSARRVATAAAYGGGGLVGFGAAAAGLAGVGGVAGKLILIDKAGLLETADRLGLFVWGEAGGGAA